MLNRNPNPHYLVIAILTIANIYFYLKKDCNLSKCEDDGRVEFLFSKFRSSESVRVNKVMKLNLHDNKTITNQDAKKLFYETLGFPLQTVCKILKRVGGTWLDVEPPGHKQVDGDKFVCMDHIVQHRRCLVYSFGIANDWSFEDQMDTLGCEVYAYDHTVNHSARRGERVRFFKTGVGRGPVYLKTLELLIRENGHLNTPIEYLKIDIEGGEWMSGGFINWFQTGVLRNIHQIGLELHVRHMDADPRQYLNLLKMLQNMFSLDFRIISQEVNMVIGPDETGYYPLIEVVFMKSIENENDIE